MIAMIQNKMEAATKIRMKEYQKLMVIWQK